MLGETVRIVFWIFPGHWHPLWAGNGEIVMREDCDGLIEAPVRLGRVWAGRGGSVDRGGCLPPVAYTALPAPFPYSSVHIQGVLGFLSPWDPTVPRESGRVRCGHGWVARGARQAWPLADGLSADWCIHRGWVGGAWGAAGPWAAAPARHPVRIRWEISPKGTYRRGISPAHFIVIEKWVKPTWHRCPAAPGGKPSLEGEGHMPAHCLDFSAFPSPTAAWTRAW